MDGFKNTTRTQYVTGYAKGGAVKGAAKVGKVMGEFKAGTLHSGSKKGPTVHSAKQAIAIGLSEARKAVVKKAEGGVMTDAEKRMVAIEKNEKRPAIRIQAPNYAAPSVNKGPMSDAEKRMVNIERNETGPAVRTQAPNAAATKANKGPMSEAERAFYNHIEKNETGEYKKGGSAQRKPSVKTADALRAQKYKAAMASRPNREPRIPVKDPAKVQMAAGAIKSAIEKAISTRAAQQPAPQAAPPMEAAAPPMMGAPAMKKGGKVMKKDKGGPIKADFPDTQSGDARFRQNEADKEVQNLKDPTYKSPLNKKGRADEMYVAQRRSDAWKSMSKYRLAPTTQKVTSDDMKSTYGPDAYKKGGMTDTKQDKAMVKKAVHKHEAAMHPGKPMTKLRKGGMPC